MNLEALMKEVSDYIESLDVMTEGEHIYDNMMEAAAISVRLQQIHNEIATAEIFGEATPEIKKFRTMILDPTIDRFDKVVQTFSRKMTGLRWEMEMGKD